MEYRKRLGELLLEAGKITCEQLDKALLENKQTRKRIGRILVAQGVISEKCSGVLIRMPMNESSK